MTMYSFKAFYQDVIVYLSFAAIALAPSSAFATDSSICSHSLDKVKTDAGLLSKLEPPQMVIHLDREENVPRHKFLKCLQYGLDKFSKISQYKYSISAFEPGDPNSDLYRLRLKK